MSSINYQPGAMLSLLEQALKDLPVLLSQESNWNGAHITRKAELLGVRTRYKGGFIYLDRILPCAPEEAVMHPHDWLAAFYIVDGSYALTIGQSEDNMHEPTSTETTIIGPGNSTYEMWHPNQWHKVVPLGGLVHSVVVRGPSLVSMSPENLKYVEPLAPSTKDELLDFFITRFPHR